MIYNETERKRVRWKEKARERESERKRDKLITTSNVNAHGSLRDAIHMMGERCSASPTASKGVMTDAHFASAHPVGDAHHSKTDTPMAATAACSEAATAATRCRL